MTGPTAPEPPALADGDGAPAPGEAAAMVAHGLALLKQADDREAAQHRAALLFRAAFRMGESAGMVHLGDWILTRPIAPERARRQAIRAFRRAAGAGNVTGMRRLGQTLLDRCTDGDEAVEARTWLERAAEAGDAQALLHFWRQAEAARNSATALGWLSRAAAAGDPGAMAMLAEYLWTGRGVAADDRAAILWYRKAAGAGHVAACYPLSVLLRRYAGSDADLAEAAALLRTAAGTCHREAMNNYAVMCLYGDGMAPARDEGLLWLHRAAAKNCATAARNLATAAAGLDGAVRRRALSYCDDLRGIDQAIAGLLSPRPQPARPPGLLARMGAWWRRMVPKGRNIPPGP
ncbi:tetratricopeptide repeat protein [Zavarzinia compransoris]|nr:tetratricopeptide repeat protein [Zavarzinia compransoris]